MLVVSHRILSFQLSASLVSYFTDKQEIFSLQFPKQIIGLGEIINQLINYKLYALSKESSGKLLFPCSVCPSDHPVLLSIGCPIFEKLNLILLVKQ